MKVALAVLVFALLAAYAVHGQVNQTNRKREGLAGEIYAVCRVVRSLKGCEL
jgi:hypothetical protein